MISIIVPVYNEDGIIFKFINQLKKLKIKKEIIVINDCSTDNTLNILKKIKNINVITNKKNLGYGYSIKKGIKKAKYDFCLTIDADGTYPVNKIIKFLKYRSSDNTLLIGKRIFKEYKLATYILRTLLKIFLFILTFKYNKDPNSGMRSFSKHFIKKYLNLCSNRFSFSTSTSLIYAIKKKEIKFIDINYNKRVGNSKIKVIKDAFATLRQIIIIIIKI